MFDSKIPKTTIASIPVYIENIEAYATEMYYLYTQIINNHTAQIHQLSGTKTENPQRSKAIARVAQAMDHNLKTLKEIQLLLAPYVKVQRLASFRPNQSDDLHGYLKDLRYIKRDWSGSAAAEKQLAQINKALEESIKPYLPSTANALFLGAGLGRISFDLAHLFEAVYAVDKSFSMVYHFHALRDRDMEFFEIDLKNIYSPEDSARKFQATMYNKEGSGQEAEKRLRKVNYFVGDVMRLPFAAGSLAAVFSVYFTDVIALRLWFEETNRVLSADGLFVHFGPLDYFFSDPREMLSAKEIREFFEARGYVTLHDEMIETIHLPVESSFVNKIYNNWLFVCKKAAGKSVTAQQTITFTSKVAINYPQKYVVHGRFDSTGQAETYELIMPNGEVYKGAETVVEILKLINVPITVQDLLDRMALKFGVLDSKQVDSILSVLGTLNSAGVISVVQ